jgi:hypothetical protein
LSAVCLSIQFTLTSEIYRFTSTPPRFPDPIPSSEKLLHLSLTHQFLTAAPADTPQVTDATAATTQLLISTLGAIHAQANPRGAWQSIKGAFAFFGNRKGQLTSALSPQLLAALASACSPDVAATVKKVVLQYSKQVKTAIRAIRGPKRFLNFGKTALAALVGLEGASQLPGIMGLSEVDPESKALGVAELNAHAQEWQMHGQKDAVFRGVGQGEVGGHGESR